MERYAPNAKDLASRDVVSRAIATEVREGRGAGPDGDYVLLELSHLGSDIIAKRLPGIRETCKTFLHIDPVEKPIPVFPTAHYVMGGIPTDRFGRVVAPSGTGAEEIVPGLYAAGECACVSVHGANRLGGNSLLDILVFGRAAGQDIIEFLKENPHHRPMNEASVEKAVERLERWDRKGDGRRVKDVRAELTKAMEDHCGVYRTEAVMAEGLERVRAIRASIGDARLTDHSRVFNTARIEALELENLADVALATIASALYRQESRGAHSRIDYPDRDDRNWLKHTLYFLDGDRTDSKPVRTKPLTVESFPPKERVY